MAFLTRALRKKIKYKMKSIEVKRIFIWLGISGLIVGGFYLFFQTSFFRISKVTIRGDLNKDQHQDVTSLITPYFLGEHLFFVSKDQARRLAVNNFPWVASIDIAKRFPDRVVLGIAKKKPAAIIKAKNGSFIIDDQGKVIALVDEFQSDLLTISLSEKVRVGESLNQNKIINYLELSRAFMEKKLVLLDLSIHQSSASAYLEGTRAVVDLKKDLRDQVSLLKQILRKYKIEGELPNRIDLRYDNPIIYDDPE